MNDKKHSSSLRKSKGFRSFVPGPVDKDQIFPFISHAENIYVCVCVRARARAYERERAWRMFIICFYNI